MTVYVSFFCDSIIAMLTSPHHFGFYVFVSSVSSWFPPHFPFQLLERRPGLAVYHCSYWAKLFVLFVPDCSLGCMWPRVDCPWFRCSPGSSHLYPDNNLEQQCLQKFCTKYKVVTGAFWEIYKSKIQNLHNSKILFWIMCLGEWVYLELIKSL